MKNKESELKARRNGKEGRHRLADNPSKAPDERRRERVKTGQGLQSVYDELKKQDIGSINCEQFQRALKFLASATNDPVFTKAAAVFKTHQFKGGLKAAVLRMFSDAGRFAANDDSLMQMIDDFVEGGCSVNKASEIAIVEFGIDGSSHDAVLTEVRKHYAEWKKKAVPVPVEISGVVRTDIIPPLIPYPLPPDGDTGDRLLVSLCNVVGTKDRMKRQSRFPPVLSKMSDDIYMVPDNRAWRQVVEEGFAIVHGLIHRSELEKT